MVARRPLPFRAPRWFTRRVEELVPLYASSSGAEADASEVVRSLLEDGLSAFDPTLIERLHALSLAWDQDARTTFAEVVRQGVLRIDPAAPVPDLPPPETDVSPMKQMAVRIDEETHERIAALMPTFARRSGEKVERSEVVRRLLSDAVVLTDTGVIVFAREHAKRRGVSLRDAFGEILCGGADAMELRLMAPVTVVVPTTEPTDDAVPPASGSDGSLSA